MDKGKIVLFLADYDYQVSQIKKIYSVLEEKTLFLSEEQPRTELTESIAYWMHNLYCAYEDLFKIIASFWENHVNFNGGFHKTLLKQMILKIEGIRPPLLSESSFKELNELRAFRHDYIYSLI